jgi:hypothetical protein
MHFQLLKTNGQQTLRKFLRCVLRTRGFYYMTILRCLFVFAGMSSLRCKSNLRTSWIRTDLDSRGIPVCLRNHSAATTVLFDRASTPPRGLSTQQMRRSMPHHQYSQWVSMTLYGQNALLQHMRAWYGVVRHMHLESSFFLQPLLSVEIQMCILLQPRLAVASRSCHAMATLIGFCLNLAI